MVTRKRCVFCNLENRQSLEDELDNMMASAPLNREQEERAIASLWQVNAVKGVNDEN